MPQRSGDGRRNEEGQPTDEASGDARRADAGANDDAGSDRGRDVSEWFAGTAVRVGLTVIGVVLLIFALGQAVGLPLLEIAVEALSTQTGRWLVVAFFAILLIGAAQRIGTAT